MAQPSGAPGKAPPGQAVVGPCPRRAAEGPAHERPGGRVPGPCRLATGQEGRVARIVDGQGLIAIGVDRSVWLDARGEDVPGPGSVPSSGPGFMCRSADLWVANYYSARNPLRLSSLVILGVVARMFRCATRSSCWCT